MSGTFSDRGDEVLMQIEADISARLVKRGGLSKDDAGAIAIEVADGLARLFSGELVYFNKSRANLIRNREIYTALRAGSTYAELSDQYGLTENHIRDIERAMLSAERAKRQIDMFPKPSNQGD